MQFGVLNPFTVVGYDPTLVRDYALQLEAMGVDFLEIPDHVLDGNPATVPSPYSRVGKPNPAYHDPFVLISFLASAAKKLSFSTGVLILPQRQTALVAKQAACVDVLTEGRLRLGIGVGWQELEFTGLNENFKNRGKRSEEQVQVMRALWANEFVTFKGRYHTIEDAGISPRPASGHIPLWYGGHHEHTLPRIAKWGDGWIPNAYPPDQAALDIFDQLRRLTDQAGRDPAQMGIEVWTSCGEGQEDDWRKEIAFWKKAGVTHICLTTTFNRRHHKAIAGRSADVHMAATKRYFDAVADLL